MKGEREEMNLLNTKLCKKTLVFLLGLNIILFGVAIFVKIGIGVDPFTVFTQGIANQLNINIGQANRILTLIILVLVLLVEKKFINIGSVFAVVFTGTFLNLHIQLVEAILPDQINVFSSLILFILACFPVSVGFPILKSAELGIAPNDAIYLCIAEKLNKPYSLVRMITDGVFVMFGFALGGVAGIGTLICVGLLGPLTEFFFPSIDKLVKKYIEKPSVSSGFKNIKLT